jgi:hypothetical protein
VGAKGHSRESMTVEQPSLSGSLSGNSSVLVAAVLAALVVAWAATNLVLGGEGFAVLVSDKEAGCSLRWYSWPGRYCTTTCGLRPTAAACLLPRMRSV